MKFKHVVEIALIALLMAIGVGIGAGAISEDAPIDKKVFDTSIIENNWCGEPTDGKIRMISAEVISDNDGLYTLMDEAGNLWEVTDVAICEDDFLLLWIADCGTAEIEDDLILKCWAEVH